LYLPLTWTYLSWRHQYIWITICKKVWKICFSIWSPTWWYSLEISAQSGHFTYTQSSIWNIGSSRLRISWRLSSTEKKSFRNQAQIPSIRTYSLIQRKLWGGWNQVHEPRSKNCEIRPVNLSLRFPNCSFPSIW